MHILILHGLYKDKIFRYKSERCEKLKAVSDLVKELMFSRYCYITVKSKNYRLALSL